MSVRIYIASNRLILDFGFVSNNLLINCAASLLTVFGISKLPKMIMEYRLPMSWS